MPKKPTLRYVETEGGPFVLLPLERKKQWHGTGDEDEGTPNDYARAQALGTGVGVIRAGDGEVLILGSPEITAFLPLEDGGVLIQRVFGDEDDDVLSAAEAAAKSADWKRLPATFDVGKGKLVLFDAACDYETSDEDERLKITLAPGKYSIERATVKTDDVELGLVRLRRA